MLGHLAVSMIDERAPEDHFIMTSLSTGEGFVRGMRVCSFRSHHGIAVYREGERAERGLRFLGSHAHLVDAKAIAAFLTPLGKKPSSCTPSGRSPVQEPCLPICHGIPTASPSQTIA
jgi:hypothetical protein